AAQRSRRIAGASREAAGACVRSGVARLHRHRDARRRRRRRARARRVRRRAGVTARVAVQLGARSYDVVVGGGAIGELGEVVAPRRLAAIVTQTTIPAEILGQVGTALNAAGVTHETFAIGDGEDAKTLATVDDLCRRFARGGLLRG